MSASGVTTVVTHGVTCYAFVTLPITTMHVTIPNKKLRIKLEDEKERIRTYGQAMAKKLELRLASLVAAKSLADFWPPFSGSERCHKLKGDLKGIFSMDLKHPMRLLFRSVEQSDGDDDDEKTRWLKIEHVEIIDIEDTHG